MASALGSPSQTFDKQLLYETFTKQATILFYSLIKNHPFQNGNKRIAVMGLLAFLSLNNKWMNITPAELYILACDVSESKSSQREIICKRIEEDIENTLTVFPKLTKI